MQGDIKHKHDCPYCGTWNWITHGTIRVFCLSCGKQWILPQPETREVDDS